MNAPHALPLFALLPPSPSAPGPSHPLPSPAYIIGPLPPTTPLHLALNHLAFEDSQARAPSPPAPSRKGKEKATASLPSEPIVAPSRVLILTGTKGDFQDCIERENERWIRDYGGIFDVMHRLKRVDMRYCPTPEHLQLYLTMVSSSFGRSRDPQECHQLEKAPSLIIVYDAAAMFLEERLVDEEPDDSESAMEQDRRQGKWQFKPGVCIHDYLNLLAAARATAHHFSSSDPSGEAARLVMLEPRLDQTAAMPIHDLTGKSCDEEATARKTWEEKKVPILNGVRRVFGWSSIGTVTESAMSQDQNDYVLSMDGVEEPFQLTRRLCEGGLWSGGDIDNKELQGGWQWTWT